MLDFWQHIRGGRIRTAQLRAGFVSIAPAMVTAAITATSGTAPAAPILKSARAVSRLGQLLMLAMFLVILFIFMVSLLIAVRRIMLLRHRGPHVKTTYIDAWKIAGQRLNPDDDSEASDELDNPK
ncbi:MAG: hypothetical protein ACP5I8_10950 [Phycisphaerae bacterium]